MLQKCNKFFCLHIIEDKFYKKYPYPLQKLGYSIFLLRYTIVNSCISSMNYTPYFHKIRQNSTRFDAM